MSDCLHCDGLSRSRLLHKAIAEAGRGLPAIEPGMPLPAGTGLSRRRFLAQGLGATLAVYGATRLGLPAFEEGIAAAASLAPQQVLVSVFLEGGADGLSVLSPQGDPLYRKLRPTLGLAGGTPLAEDPRLFWHPATGGLAQLYGEHKVTVMPAVGYTHPDQSHFTSRHYWEVGATSTQLNTGWLGRYLDAVGTMDNPLQGVSFDDTLAPSLGDREGAGRGHLGARPVRLLLEPRLGRGAGPDARVVRAVRGADRPGAAHRGERRPPGRPPAQAAAAVPLRRTASRGSRARWPTRSRTTRSRRSSPASPR